MRLHTTGCGVTRDGSNEVVTNICNGMKRYIIALLALSAIFAPSVSNAQDKADPSGYVTYSLPSTVIALEVDAVQEKFYAGPYAKFAEKYLGIKARQKDEASYQLTSVKMTPYVEADQSRRYSLELPKGQGPAFLKLTSQGLVSISDGGSSESTNWRFPTAGKGDFSDKGVSSNLTSESTTLYRNDKKESEYNKVSVQQNMIVEKSLEKKAAETAQMILDIRDQRLRIVTGDTDATYSGAAMGAAIDELTRLEKEYLMLFIGYSEFQTQKMNFEVIPQAGETQMYIAFRLSDAAGLVPADNLSGKPVVMEIVPQKFAEPEGAPEAAKSAKGAVVNYRIPAICNVKLMDGVNMLLQSRIPVYQLGRESSTPLK